jgi:hypothetical protein
MEQTVKIWEEKQQGTFSNINTAGNEMIKNNTVIFAQEVKRNEG